MAATAATAAGAAADGAGAAAPADAAGPAVRAVAVAVPAVAVAVRAVAAEVPAVAAGAEVRADALAQARQAPQAAPWPPRRRLARPGQGPVRRIRTEVARGRLADQPPDRGGPNRDDPQDQARRQGLDQRLSRQAGHQEAG